MNVNTHVCGPTLVLASSSTGLMPVLRRELGPLRGVRMAFIPTASTVESYGVLVRLMRIRFALAGLRVQMVDPERMPAAQVCARLQSSDIIYVGGGNTFHLMHHLHAADADDVIRKLVREGVPYVGESAGAVVASDDISYIAPMDENRGHTRMRGLWPSRASMSFRTSARCRWAPAHVGSSPCMPGSRTMSRCSMVRHWSFEVMWLELPRCLWSSNFADYAMHAVNACTVQGRCMCIRQNVG